MIIENFITNYLRKFNEKNLTFETDKDIEVPKPSNDKKNLLLYIHIPFCEELCPYCSFNRFKFEPELAKNYFKALKKEILLYKNLGFDFAASYIGGGTPTIMINELVEILNLIKTNFTMKEISCETNPNHLSDERLKLLLKYGVDRLSVGVQSFNNTLLKQMQRFHKYGSGEEIKKRLQEIMGMFPTLNIDMIFNFPTQTIEILRKDCDIIKELKADQVTFYPLMVSTSTQKIVEKNLGKVDYAKEKLFYFEIIKSLGDEYSPGTAWCFSRKKTMIDEYIIDYDEYLGVGSGAFGYYDGRILSNTFAVPKYIESLNQNKLPLSAEKKFSQIEQMRYDFLIKFFGTKLSKNFILSKYGKIFYKKLWKEFLFFKLLGSFYEDENFYYLTQKGQYYWVIMMREFFIGVNNFRDYCRRQINEQ